MKLEAIEKKLDKVEIGTTIGTFEVDIGCIRTDPTMQVRDRLDDGNKKRLRSAYKSGADVPPITVAFIGGTDPRPVVIDGHHRINVLETLATEGRDEFTKVSIKAVKLSRDAARYKAAIANNTHPCDCCMVFIGAELVRRKPGWSRRSSRIDRCGC